MKAGNVRRVSSPVAIQLPTGTAPLLRMGWQDDLDHLREERLQMMRDARGIPFANAFISAVLIPTRDSNPIEFRIQ